MKRRENSASLGASLVVLSSFFYATYGIWTKLMGGFFGGYTASALRSLVVLIIIVPISLALKKFEPLKLKNNWKFVAGIIATSFFIWGPLYYAVINAGVGLAITVNYASLVIGLLFFGWLIVGEKFTRVKWLSASIGLVGLALVFLPSSGDGSFVLLPLAAAVLSGLSIALMSVFIKLVSYNAMQTTVISWTASVFANATMALLFKEVIPAIGFKIQWMYLLVFSVASVIASLSLNRGIKLIEAGTAGILGLLEIVFAIIFGVVLFNEQPTVVSMAGVVLIILSAAIPYIRQIDKIRTKVD